MKTRSLGSGPKDLCQCVTDIGTAAFISSRQKPSPQVTAQVPGAHWLEGRGSQSETESALLPGTPCGAYSVGKGAVLAGPPAVFAERKVVTFISQKTGLVGSAVH